MAPKDGMLEVNALVTVEVEGLERWRQIDPLRNSPLKLIPYLNGMPLRGVYPFGPPVDGRRLTFNLDLTAANHRIWTQLIGAPSFWPLELDRAVEFSVGPEDAGPFATQITAEEGGVRLIVISKWWGVAAGGAILLTIGTFVWLARRTAMMREPGPPLARGRPRPFSLGRAQMAFWFLLTASSYIVIWLITDSYDDIPPSLIAVMGISAGTALGELVVDSRKDDQAMKHERTILAEKQALEQSVKEVENHVAALATQKGPAGDEAVRAGLTRDLLEHRTRLNSLTHQARRLDPRGGEPVSEGFFRDILSDGHGYSLHRFQIVIWTAIMGLLFIYRVYYELTMPEISPSMLALMGVSAGTYVGFKIPESR